jgi:thiol-disulfide isomerase/thioredoxin
MGSKAEATLGLVSREELLSNSETQWFKRGYDRFSLDQDEDDGENYERILEAADRFASIEVLAFVGIWCGDTQVHLPGFVRILDALGDAAKFPLAQFKIYSLDRAKTFPGGEALLKKYDILRLPTFVFLEKGKELGRITEEPELSLLADMARIIGAPKLIQDV